MKDGSRSKEDELTGIDIHAIAGIERREEEQVITREEFTLTVEAQRFHPLKSSIFLRNGYQRRIHLVSVTETIEVCCQNSQEN